MKYDITRWCRITLHSIRQSVF